MLRLRIENSHMPRRTDGHSVMPHRSKDSERCPVFCMTVIIFASEAAGLLTIEKFHQFRQTRCHVTDGMRSSLPERNLTQ